MATTMPDHKLFDGTVIFIIWCSTLVMILLKSSSLAAAISRDPIIEQKRFNLPRMCCLRSLDLPNNPFSKQNSRSIYKRIFGIISHNDVDVLNNIFYFIA